MAQTTCLHLALFVLRPPLVVHEMCHLHSFFFQISFPGVLWSWVRVIAALAAASSIIDLSHTQRLLMQIVLPVSFSTEDTINSRLCTDVADADDAVITQTALVTCSSMALRYSLECLFGSAVVTCQLVSMLIAFSY